MWNPDNSELLKYLEQARSGEVIIGKELLCELMRLEEDILSERYEYNTESARLRIDFLSNCVRLTKSPFYNQPMKLMQWQKAFVEALYSFKMPNGFDRFQRAIMLIARKNTKSETTSALGLAELICGNAGSDIVCSSNDDNQASIVYNSIDTMRTLIDPKSKLTWRNQQCLSNLQTGSKVFKLSDRTRNKEGRNIDFAIVDEAHEMKDNVITKSIEQSQSLKDNPKLIIITTEGFVNDGFLDAELKRARAILNGESCGLADERYLPWLYTQDSEREVWEDRSSWVKSNPTLGIVKKWDYLDAQVDIARRSKPDRAFVLAKDFNVKSASSEAWLDWKDYNYNSDFDVADLKGCYAVGAVDLSETVDLTCAKVMVVAKSGKKYVLTRYFMPETKLHESTDQANGAKYEEWVKGNYIEIAGETENELERVADWFYSLYVAYGIRVAVCGYDQRFSKTWIDRMNYYGWSRQSGELELINQNAETLSTAIKLCEMDFRKRNILYGDNPVDKWCLQNAQIKVDSKGNGLIVKANKAQKIDGAVTFAILYETYRRHRNDIKLKEE